MNIKKLYILIFTIFLSNFLFSQPFEEHTILLATDGEINDMFGNSLSISGNIGVVGTPQDDDIISNGGAVYVYEKDENNLWHIKDKLNISDAEEADMLGIAVDIDGDYIVAGAYQASGLANATNRGAAYIFKRNGDSWDLQQKIFADDGEMADNFGRSVAISGNYIVAGSPNNDFGTGAIYVFHRSEENWTQIAKFIENDGNMNDYFGYSVDISGDYIVSGAWQNNAPDSNTGAVYVFYNNAGTWEFNTKLIADDAQIDDALGYSVAISGLTIVAGSHAQNGAKGASYVFVNNAETWSQQAKLLASNGSAEDYFGKNISISGDYILVAAQRHDNSKSDEGAVYLFQRNGTNWNETNIFTASDATDTGLFGYCTAIDNNFALISTVQENGKVYVFGPEVTSITENKNRISFYPNPASKKISFYFSNLIKNNSKIQLIDLTGKIVFEKKINSEQQTINISKLKKGIYFIKMNIDGEVITEKIIKN